MGYRIVSFDFGNKNTGCVMADIDKKRNHFEIILIKYMEVCREGDMMKCIIEFIDNIIIPMTKFCNDVVFVYENVHTRKLYPNWNLIRLQKCIRNYVNKCCSNVSIKVLRPSQKAFIGGTKRKDRKDLAVFAAREYIINHSCYEMVTLFDNLSRKHDVADAMLAIAYMYINNY